LVTTATNMTTGQIDSSSAVRRVRCQVRLASVSAITSTVPQQIGSRTASAETITSAAVRYGSTVCRALSALSADVSTPMTPTTTTYDDASRQPRRFHRAMTAVTSAADANKPASTATMSLPSVAL
jgi:hypothetical protein